VLMLAVLEDAIDCYQKYAHARDPRGAQIFQESREWVDSNDRTWLFSFENICDTLEINADYVSGGSTRPGRRSSTSRPTSSPPCRRPRRNATRQGVPPGGVQRIVTSTRR